MDVPQMYCAPFHESSNRPHLLLGCEPTLLALAFVLTVIVGYSVPTWWGIGGAVLLFVILRQLLRELAKADPRFAAIHMEAQRYNQRFWTAKPRRAILWRSR